MGLLKILRYIDANTEHDLHEVHVTHYVIKINKTNAATLRQLYFYKNMKRTVKVICDISDVRDVKDIVKYCIEYGMDGILIKRSVAENESRLRDFVNRICYIVDSLPYPYNFRWEIILDNVFDFELQNRSKFELNFDIIKKGIFDINNGYICIEWSNNVNNIVEKYKMGKSTGLLCNKVNNINYPSSKFIFHISYDNHTILSIIDQYL